MKDATEDVILEKWELLDPEIQKEYLQTRPKVLERTMWVSIVRKASLLLGTFLVGCLVTTGYCHKLDRDPETLKSKRKEAGEQNTYSQVRDCIEACKNQYGIKCSSPKAQPVNGTLEACLQVCVSLKNKESLK